MNKEKAQFIIDVLTLASDRYMRDAQRGTKEADAAQGIADHYGKLKYTLGFEEAAKQSKLAFLMSLDENETAAQDDVSPLASGHKVTYERCFGDDTLTYIAPFEGLRYDNDCIVVREGRPVPAVLDGLKLVNDVPGSSIPFFWSGENAIEVSDFLGHENFNHKLGVLYIFTTRGKVTINKGDVVPESLRHVPASEGDALD